MDYISVALANSGIPAALEAAKELISKLLGPSAEEVGLLLQDRVRQYRLRNQLKVLGKTQQILVESGIEPKSVPLRILVPLLEAASLNDDENLSERWATLLANASLGNPSINLYPTFVRILDEISAHDVLILDYMRKQMWVYGTSDNIQYYQFRPKIQEALKLPDIDYEVLVDNLVRLGLCISDNSLLPDTVQKSLNQVKELDGKLIRRDVLILTELGIEFTNACTKAGSTRTREGIIRLKDYFEKLDHSNDKSKPNI